MSTPNPIEVAAIPSAIAALTALKTFIASLQGDPAQIPLKLPGALQVFLGTLELQIPTLATSEVAAVFTEANTKIDGLISSLKAKLPA